MGNAEMLPSTGGGAHDDWVPSIISMLKAQQRDWYDRNSGTGRMSEWMLSAPNPGAAPDDIHAAETTLGLRFDDQYRQWLSHVNGWTAFSGGGDLYPLGDISKNSPEHRAMLDMFRESLIEPGDLEMDSFDNLVLIGGTPDGIQYVTVGSPEQRRTAAPVWEIEDIEYTRFGDLKEFLTREVVSRRGLMLG